MTTDPRKFRSWAQLAQERVRRTMEELPLELSSAADEVPVSMAGRPDRALIDAGFEPDLLGLFEGECLAERGTTLDPTPPHITLFVENIAEFVEGDPTSFEEEVGITYLHELGHYLGWDEDDLARRQLD